MLTKLFESLDETVFTTELKEALEVQFNEAVEAKAIQIAEDKINEEIESLNTKSEEHIEYLNEKAEEYVETVKTELVEQLDKYLDRVVNDFMNEAKESLDESVKSEKADMIIEAFESMLVATGVDVARIVEAKEDESVQTELSESVAKNDALVEEILALKEENNKLIKIGVINEMKEGLSIVEAQKFEKLADLVEFSKDEAFTEKLQTIKESVKGAAEVKEEKLDESVQKGEKPVWAHLV